MFTNSRKLLIPLATMAIAGAVTVGSGANWTSTTTKSSVVSAGKLLHSDGAGGATLNLADLKPGDVMSGTLTVTNTGSVDSYLSVVETASSNAFSDVSLNVSALQLTITAEGMTAPLYDGDFGDWVDAESRQVKNAATTDPAVLDKPVVGPPAVLGESLDLVFKVSLAANAAATDQQKLASASYSIVTVPAAGQNNLLGTWN